MNAKDFFELVAALRFQQKTYFKTRSADALQKSKELEKRLDTEIDRVNAVLAERAKHQTPNT